MACLGTRSMHLYEGAVPAEGIVTGPVDKCNSKSQKGKLPVLPKDIACFDHGRPNVTVTWWHCYML